MITIFSGDDLYHVHTHNFTFNKEKRDFYKKLSCIAFFAVRLVKCLVRVLVLFIIVVFIIHVQQISNNLYPVVSVKVIIKN